MTRALFALPLAAFALAGCGSSSSSSASSAASAPTTSSSAAPAPGGSSATQVTMKSLAFTPAVVHVKAGGTVEWINRDGPPHNVSYGSGPKFTSSGTLNTGDTFKLKLSQPGTIHYFCTIHPFMKATIIVSK